MGPEVALCMQLFTEPGGKVSLLSADILVLFWANLFCFQAGSLGSFLVSKRNVKVAEERSVQGSGPSCTGCHGHMRHHTHFELSV